MNGYLAGILILLSCLAGMLIYYENSIGNEWQAAVATVAVIATAIVVKEVYR